MIRGAGAQSAFIGFVQLVLDEAERAHPALSVIEHLDRRYEKAQDELFLLSGDGGLGHFPQDFQFAQGVAVRIGFQLRFAERVELDFFRQGEGIRAFHFSEFLDFRVGEGRLGRAAAAEHVHLLHPALAKRFQRIIGDIGSSQFLRRAGIRCAPRRPPHSPPR